MKVYMYCAAYYCESCGEDLCETVAKPEGVDPDNESTWDSDDYPKGPYPDSGGEADTPQHCSSCGVFLENPLTPDGYKYLSEQADPYVSPDDESGSWALVADRAEDDGNAVIAEWVRFYHAPGM